MHSILNGLLSRARRPLATLGLASAIMLGPLAGGARADSILLTLFDNQFNGSTDVYAEMAANLQAAGHTTTVVDARTGGNLAAALSGGSFDQVFLWDLTATLYLDASDISALSGFYDDNSSLVIDTRSYGYYYQGSQASEVALLQNVADNLSLAGGGVWVGTDHDPDWTRNANPFLAAIGVNPVTGIHGEPVNTADPSSVLLDGVTPTDLWAAGQTVGTVPLGLQPNGSTLFFHFGHTAGDGSLIPYIAASFDLRGPDPDPDPEPEPDPDPVPEPGSLGLMALGLVGGVAAHRRRR